MELKLDIEQTYERLTAYWHGQPLDRVCIDIRVRKEGYEPPAFEVPATVEEQWTNVEYAVAKAVAEVESYTYLGESLPIIRVGLGPDFLAATLGCKLKFTADTSWAAPCINSWDTFKGFPEYRQSRWYKLQVELTERLTEAAEGRFIVETPDLHPGGDAIAALRGTTEFRMDFYDAPEQLKKAIGHIDQILCEMVDTFETITTARGQRHCVGYLPWGPGKTYPVADDSLALISPAIAEEFIIPAIRRRAAHLDCAMLHLDGPQALDKLDLILELPELDGIQWQPGVSNRPMMKWIPLMNRILESGKILTVDCTSDQVENILAEVASKGLHIIVTDAKNQAQAEEILKIAANRKLYRK